MTAFPLTPAPADAFALYEAVFAHVSGRMDAAVLFAATTGATMFWLSRPYLLRLWRVGHLKGLGQGLHPASRILAIGQRGIDGATTIYVARGLLDVDHLAVTLRASLAVARLAAHLAARRDLGERGRLQIVALDDVDAAVHVEQYPTPRVLRAAWLA